MKFFNHIPSEEEMDLRLKCAVMYTDIGGLAQCVLSFLYDLQEALEEEGKFKQGNKRSVNRAMDHAVKVTSHLQDEINEPGTGYLKSYIKLYDDLVERLDKSVSLSGTERCLSLIDTSCAMISNKFVFLREHNHTFPEVKDLETMPMVAKFIRDIPGERYDLEPIVRSVLTGMLTPEEKEIAREHYKEAIKHYQELKNQISDGKENNQ